MAFRHKIWEYIADTDEIYHYRCWEDCGWYLYGDRTIPTPGSNTIGAISVTWNDCLSVQPDYNLLVKVANSIEIHKGFVHSEEVISLLKIGGYADDSGKILIPIIDSSNVPTMISIGDHIAQIITSTVKESVSQCNLLADIDNHNAAEVILCHELMYDIMEELVAEKLISVPNALRG